MIGQNRNRKVIRQMFPVALVASQCKFGSIMAQYHPPTVVHSDSSFVFRHLTAGLRSDYVGRYVHLAVSLAKGLYDVCTATTRIETICNRI